ncbi:MAG: exodeoxyribonuclease VII small subunit [Candidatus Saccharimonadales bacterium]
MTKITKSYRELMDELDTVMQALQADDLDVDAAITHYENGIRLTKEIEAYLTKSENKLTELRKTASE